MSADVKSIIDPPPIPLVNLELEYEHATYSIKVKIRRNPSSAASETYNMNTFDDGQPEEFLTLLNKFKISIDGGVTTAPSALINYLRMILCGQELREFDELQIQNGG